MSGERWVQRVAEPAQPGPAHLVARVSEWNPLKGFYTACGKYGRSAARFSSVRWVDAPAGARRCSKCVHEANREDR